MSLRSIRRRGPRRMRTVREWVELRRRYAGAIRVCLGREGHDLNSLFAALCLECGPAWRRYRCVDELREILWMMGYGLNSVGTIVYVGGSFGGGGRFVVSVEGGEVDTTCIP